MRFPMLADRGGVKVVTFPLSIATHSGLRVHNQVSRGQTDVTSVISMSNRSSTLFPVLADCSGAISKVATVPFGDILNYGIWTILACRSTTSSGVAKWLARLDSTCSSDTHS